jgi:hypothetical protein
VSGWIKLHRKMLDNPIVCKDSDHLAVWTYLLLNATHKEHPAVFGKEKITLMPGQLITGRIAISQKLRVSESKVQRILSAFESEHQIEQQTGNKNRLISIISWSDYQDSEQQDEPQMNNKRTTDEQQMNTNKNERSKEQKNVTNKDPKTYYAEFVSLSEKEFTTLVKDLGEDFTQKCIVTLDNYKGAKGTKYKSDYRAILNWVIERVREDERKLRVINGGVANASQGGFNRNVRGNEAKGGALSFSDDELDRIQEGRA